LTKPMLRRIVQVAIVLALAAVPLVVGNGGAIIGTIKIG